MTDSTYVSRVPDALPFERIKQELQTYMDFLASLDATHNLLWIEFYAHFIALANLSDDLRKCLSLRNQVLADYSQFYGANRASAEATLTQAMNAGDEEC